MSDRSLVIKTTRGVAVIRTSCPKQPRVTRRIISFVTRRRATRREDTGSDSQAKSVVLQSYLTVSLSKASRRVSLLAARARLKRSKESNSKTSTYSRAPISMRKVITVKRKLKKVPNGRAQASKNRILGSYLSLITLSWALRSLISGKSS